MLEIKNLTKVYKSKAGAEVRALDGVSVRFEEKGMVFLLGKSGSGKSTLLNLCGGLDSPDSGEIIIKGRSSKEFTQSDFDSYRNTFIGFIFQEYNILNEFTVEDNIALALELQGKNKDKQQVLEILKQVELENFAKRKPNTLSGGQKQRVAIARALVKNPEIIMADEPTGALDSNTGKQVFDTLKALSKDKLVIVVSHDREFAEIYGDRIIELKDGKIISDVTKTKIAATKTSENVTFIGDDTISVKNGAALTDADMAQIRRFLSSANGNVIISGGEKEIADFKKAARIDEDNARENFKDTDEKQLESKTYTREDSNFIRSKLPARHAVRIGASSMKIKPFRLFFTIFLSFIAFTMFGLFSTLTFYDGKSVALESYMTSGYESITFQKQYQYTCITEENGEITYSYTSSRDAKFTPADLETYAQKYGSAAALYNYNNYSNGFTVMNVNENKRSDYYIYFGVGSFAEIHGTSPWEILTSETNLSDLGENDIVISSFMFDAIKYFGFTDDNAQLNSYTDILGKTLRIRSNVSSDVVPLTVRGVYKLEPPATYDAIKEGSEGLTNDLIYEYQRLMQSGNYYSVIVGNSFYNAHAPQFLQTSSEWVDYGFSSLQQNFSVQAESNDDSQYYVNHWLFSINYPEKENYAKPELCFYQDGKVSLSDGEILLPISALTSYYNILIEKEATEIYNSIANPDGDGNIDGDVEQAEDKYNEYYQKAQRYLQFLQPDHEEALAEIKRLDAKYSDLWDKTVNLIFSDSEQLYKSFRVVGFFYGQANSQNSDGAYFSQNDYDDVKERAGNPYENDSYKYYEVTKYVAPQDAIYNYIVTKFPDRSSMSAIIDGQNAVNADDDTFYVLSSPLSDSLQMVDSMIEMLEQVFLWVGVVMAVFAMLLLFNFISVSITYKKKEIGILRAVGARSADVFKIFYSESAIISAICFVLAMIASFVVCGVLNNVLADGVGVAIFVFGPLSWLVMLGIAVLTSFIATFLPVYGIAKKKPVESIRAL